MNNGYLDVDGRTLAADDASCSLSQGDLYVDCRGDDFTLSLVGVPFGDAKTIADLPGRVWEPHDDALAYHSDVFAEGGLTIDDRRLLVERARVTCLGYGATNSRLKIEIELEAEDETWGGRKVVSGTIICDIE